MSTVKGPLIRLTLTVAHLMLGFKLEGLGFSRVLP